MESKTPIKLIKPRADNVLDNDGNKGKKKKKAEKLPNRIIPISNADKFFHEKWYTNRGPLNIPHPYRCVCLGPPNSGKSTIVKHLIMHANPEFEEVYIVHCDPENTAEYDDLGDDVEITDTIPEPDRWNADVKSLVVLDDLEYKGMSKQQLHCLDRLFGYVSTHKNKSVVLCSQDPFNVPPCVRRMSNLWVLWKQNDLDALSTVARKTGMSTRKFRDLFALCQKPHDSIWIDMTDHSPMKLRLNGFKNIDNVV